MLKSLPNLKPPSLLPIVITALLGCEAGIPDFTKNSAGDESAANPLFPGAPPAQLQPINSLKLSNEPTGVSSVTLLNISVIGIGFSQYRYKLGLKEDTSCIDSIQYSSPITMTTPIADDLTSIEDKDLVLCVIAQESSGLWQPYSEALVSFWGKDTNLPKEVNFSVHSKEIIESNSTGSFTITLSGPKASETVVTYTVGGDAILALDHNLIAGQITIPSGKLEAIATYNLFDNNIDTSDRQLNIGLVSATGTNVNIGSKGIQNNTIRDTNGSSITRYQSVSVGFSHSCGIESITDELKCWGSNKNGQLGNGSNTLSLYPKAIATGTQFSQVSLGRNFTCALTNGSLNCWGKNSSGQIGDNSNIERRSPVSINLGVLYSQVALGEAHVCAIQTLNNELHCWGANAKGQLGIGTLTDSWIPTAVDSGIQYSQVALGHDHTCAVVLGTGALKCWGSNSEGQIGDGTTVRQKSPVVIDAGTGYSKVATGKFHTCALVNGSGELRCWGNNSNGQLGDNSTFDHLTPTASGSAHSFSQIEMGNQYSCGLKASGELFCWGSATSGGIGDGSHVDQLHPVPVDVGQLYASVALKDRHTCGRLISGRLKCWGGGISGELGDGTRRLIMAPKIIDLGTSYNNIVLGEHHTCGSTSLGSLRCWGANGSGQLGLNNTVPSVSPIVLDAGFDFTQLALGAQHSCGITAMGQLYCWGKNSNGQLGDGTYLIRLTPVLIDSSTAYIRVALGSFHTCGITTNQKLKCWGANSSGLLGNGGNTNRTLPEFIDATTTYTDVALATSHSCALTTNGDIKCWGSGYQGRLGNGDTANRLTPTAINSLANFSKIAVGLSHSCGIDSTDQIQCWGYNVAGQLGDGTTTESFVPKLIDNGNSYTQIDLGEASSCGLTSANGLRCWGTNSYGQLGDGTTTDRNNPIDVELGTQYSTLSLRRFQTCAIEDNGTLKCWGLNTGGQLGDLNLYNVPIFVSDL